jgi:dihydroorotate dehydrogenase electron transfer subunit
MRQVHATIIQHQEIQRRHFRMRVLAPEVARSAKAGQFVHVLPRQAANSFDPLLRRAFSIAAIEADHFDIVYRVEGRGTLLLSQQAIGAPIDMLGPLGVPFARPPARSILVGGGVGVPPMAHGRVTNLLQPMLAALSPDEERPLVYACGPLPMLRAVASLCARFEMACQVSLEECMPCGVGVCNGCVVPVREANDDYGLYRRVCVEGPVMWAHEVAWQE